ncbi:helix-turn-helix domain-containing protein [uncultured Oscillibacter sp.]|uniref:helix-turn-helix domain-containing protein n=1 Tax=uncultured Oscillibacter sp. TaxID=876091 RepID=UPI0025FD25A6|nr:helix-turn-helix domain-containing protein [uncultured Oscillibacter sp.]
MTLSEHLFQLRTETGLKQQELADKVGISLSGYQNYERGLREPPLSTLVALADFYDLSLDELVGRERCVRVTALLENTACRPGLAAAHGLSLYIQTPLHNILFDMGPDEAFLANAQALGVDLEAVDVAVLSHGHYDHGGGLAAFCRLNTRAAVYLHRAAFGAYYAVEDGGEPAYIGLPLELAAYRDRFRLTGGETVIDRELTLFSDPPRVFDALDASAALREKMGEDFRPDGFAHEQNLLIRAAGKTVLIAGCAHRGIVNILRGAEDRLGRRPDAAVGGFHLFQLAEGDPEADALIDRTGQALLPGATVYYTGHCTGEYAYRRLRGILGERLCRLSGGGVVEI